MSIRSLVQVSEGRFDERPDTVSETQVFDAGPGLYDVTLCFDGEELGNGAVILDGDGYAVSDSDDAAGDCVLYGSMEHHSYPIETLHLAAGDCKNTSALY